MIWSKHDFARSHSSPILINVQGQDQLVLFMDKEIVGIDPNSGGLLWTHAHGLAGGLTISSPVWGQDQLLFCSSAYEGGSRAIQLKRENGKTSVKEVWFSSRMRVHHGNVIRIGDYAYGSSGDFGPAFFSAVHVPSGEIAWRDRTFSKAVFLYADKKLIILDEDGNLGAGHTAFPRD